MRAGAHRIKVSERKGTSRETHCRSDENIFRDKDLGKDKVCEARRNKPLRQCFFILGLLSVLLMICGCDGRGIIPDSMIPQSLKSGQSTAFSRAGQQGQASSGTGQQSQLSAGEDQIQGSSEKGDKAGETVEGKSQDSTSGGDGDTYIYIHVCGCVKKPGVYRLAAGSRVCDAIKAAGGLGKEADSTWWNQAGLLTDGMQVRVPSKEEVSSGQAGSPGEITTGTAGSANTGGTGSGEPEKNGKDDRVNINTATAEELVTIPGIGAKRAEDIISYRQEHGNFSSIEDIRNVSGIGDGIYTRIKDHIRVD